MKPNQISDSEKIDMRHPDQIEGQLRAAESAAITKKGGDADAKRDSESASYNDRGSIKAAPKVQASGAA